MGGHADRRRRVFYIAGLLTLMLVAALVLSEADLPNLDAQSNPTATVASSAYDIATMPATPNRQVTEVWSTVTPGTPAITPLPTRTP
jgi:hypothetical protein